MMKVSWINTNHGNNQTGFREAGSTCVTEIGVSVMDVLFISFTAKTANVSAAAVMQAAESISNRAEIIPGCLNNSKRTA